MNPYQGNLVSLSQGLKVQEIAVGAVFALTRFSLVLLSKNFHSRPGCRQKSLLILGLGPLGWGSTPDPQFGQTLGSNFLSVSPLESMRSRGAIPPLKRGISAILPRYPTKTRQMGAIPPSAILSRKGIARYGGVSRIGPLSSRALTGFNAHSSTPTPVLLTSREETQTMLREKLGPKPRPRQTLDLPGKGETQTMV